jgi:MFS family permease
VTTANFIAMFLGAAMFGMFYFASLYLQDVLHYSPLKTGLAFLPSPLAIIAGAQISSRLAGRYPAKWFLMAGPLTAGIALLWLSRVPVHGAYFEHVFGPFLLVGLGMGVTMVQMTIAATAGVPPQLAGLASGLVNTGRQIGAAVGLAILETVATSRTHHVSATGAPISKALTSGFDRGLLLAGIILLAAVIVASTLPRPTPPPAPETPAELREEADEKAQYSVVAEV